MANHRVLTPGGFRDPRLVHRLGPEFGVARATGILCEINMRTKELTDLPKATERIAPGPPLGNGWITDTFFANATGQPFTEFSTTWRVPAALATQDSQTIF